MMHSSPCIASATSRLLAAAGLALGSTAAIAQASVDSVQLQLRWIETLPDDAVHTPLFLFAFHNGEIDFFDHDRPAPALLADVLSRMTTAQELGGLIGELLPQFDPVQWVGMRSYPHGEADFSPPPPFWSRYRQATVTLDPRQHRFLSYVVRIQPSDDAFAGNEDPYEIQLFDADGRFVGPHYLDVFGSQVLDAGLCANQEASLQWLDWHLDPPTAGPACEQGEGLVQRHPGLNGSQRNPDSAPQRVLGGTLASEGVHPALFYDPVHADFSRPGYKLGRLTITRSDASRFAPTGSWYSPEHAGEGFNFELVEPHEGAGPPRLLVYWYTYEPDGSGRQVWLSGLAEMEPQQAGVIRVDLIRSEGGRFASTDNPDLVERTPWGHLDLSFHSCSEGTARYEPLDPDWPAGEYTIHRLSPAIEGLGWLCRPQDAALVLPDGAD